MENSEEPIRPKPYRRSLATLTKLVESYQAKWKLIKSGEAALKRKITGQSVKIDDLQYTVETLRTLLRSEQATNTEESIELIKITKALKSKAADILHMEVQIKELKQDKRNLNVTLKENEKIKVKLTKLTKLNKLNKLNKPIKSVKPTKLANPTKHTSEYWKSLYLAEIKRIK
tara:strand:- start:8085 stop:8603 length:519 start_codon:yes stop_codon:yes gene_type:complete